ncbi:Arginine utilization regulatory protein RocR [Sporomusa carbonis]
MDLNQIIGASPVLEAVKQQACRYAMASSTVLITGESGTGKEMFAQSIHNLSPRAGEPVCCC